MTARSRRDRALAVAEVLALLSAIGLAWWIGRVATDAWLERVSGLRGLRAPPIDDVLSSSRAASFYFAAGLVVLAAGRIVGLVRARDPLRLPLLLPGLVLACLLGLSVHHATVEVALGAGTIALPTAATFAQGFLVGAVIATAFLVVPFDLVALVARLWAPIAVVIVLVFVALAVAGSGPGTSGARINLGPIQPIEAVKVLFVVFLAGYLGSRASKLRWQRERFLALRWPRFALLLPAAIALVAIFAGLYVIGDLGPVLILAVVFLAVFYAVTRATGWIFVSVAIVSALVTIAAVFPEIVNVGRVATRIRMWRDPWWNGIPHGDQLGESLWAIASGGAWGQGLAQNHAPIVPAGKTDLVLATLVEQIGIAGLFAYLLALAAIVGSGMYVAARTRTPERALLAGGASMLLVVQWAVIHAGTVGAFPLTGVVVPFVSAGRSSMIAFVAVIGLIARVADDGPARAETPELAELHRTALGLAAAAALFLVGGAVAGAHIALLDGERVTAMGIATQLADRTVVIRPNPRLLALAAKIRRGTIADRQGAPLAITHAPSTARTYPLGASMGTLLGAHPSRVLLPPWALERVLDRRLRGYGDRTDAPGGRRWPDLRTFLPLLALDPTERTARLRALDANVGARSVRLSIDARLQRDVAGILRRRVGSGPGLAAAAVVLDVDTGQVLARAQSPDLEPADATWQTRMAARDPTFLPRFTGAYGEWPDKTDVQGVFQSGSVGKIFTALVAARAHQSGLVFSCTERDEAGPLFTRPGWTRPIHDHVRDRNHGRVDLVEAIAVSCNVYFGQLALALGPDPFAALRDAGAQIGYGASRRFDAGAPGSRQLASTGFGQGALAMSVSQAARLVAAIASGGRYRRCPPNLELAATCSEVALVDDPSALAPILAGMRRVMTHGTGRSLQAPAGVRIYGKTGTADVRGFAGEAPFGIAPGRDAEPHSWFVAIAEPTDIPEGQPVTAGRIVIAVVVPRGGAGATTAGPITMQIAALLPSLGYVHIQQ